jgi:hypothetical protein
MLSEIQKSTLSPSEQLAAIIRGFDAVDTESGAYLFKSRGMTRGRMTMKFTLVLPHESAKDRGGFFGLGKTFNASYKRFRCYSHREALERANKALPKMLKEIK